MKYGIRQRVASCVIEAAVSHFGKIDNLVNNAGINNRSSMIEMGIDDWQEVMDVNLNSTLYFCRAALPYYSSLRPCLILLPAKRSI
ncbi:SDR family NAD(P)-dependent oxidoreductase [Paenibacillus sp. Leaf72]|uniref:SDR family NAD(P)-dependent oxidoreductase n=1 Tax=Paenibacillus sp. Leaf72 TaxID=1736234 RepID=UPI000AF8056F|nr:SDR family NAD(P)-dependent oxidoreductase [Paenibacillus sp. Leaf72]